jgi:hypothetical protein
MSELVAVALITGGLTLPGSLGAQWLGSRDENKRARVQFEANLKARLMDYEREDRLSVVRPLRDYLVQMGESFGNVTPEMLADPAGTAADWYMSVSTQILRGTTLRYLIDDDEICSGMDGLISALIDLADAGRDFLGAPTNSQEYDDALARVRSITGKMRPLARDVCGRLDRFARLVEIPALGS